jgi:hypothetical protein
MKYLLNSLILMLGSTTVYAGVDTVPGRLPEPGIYALLAIGAIGMFIARKRKK